MTLTDNARGAIWMMASMFGFVINDALMKSLAGSVPLFQVILIRGAMATAMVLAFALAIGALRFRPGPRDQRAIVFRMIGEIGATCLFLTALFNMPIANATAILQAAALALTLAAALFLGERVGWRRYSAIAIGFVGVLLIVKPGTSGFTVYSLCALGSVGFIVLRDLATRSLSPGVPGLMVTVFTSSAITLAGLGVTLWRGWQPVEPRVFAVLFAAACFLMLGYYAGIAAMRIGEIGAVSPFRYTNLIWALLIGIFVFGDVPDVVTLTGTAVIVATGLYTLHRERRARVG